MKYMKNLKMETENQIVEEGAISPSLFNGITSTYKKEKILKFGLWHMHIFCSNASSFVYFEYDW